MIYYILTNWTNLFISPSDGIYITSNLIYNIYNRYLTIYLISDVAIKDGQQFIWYLINSVHLKKMVVNNIPALFFETSCLATANHTDVKCL